MNEYNRKKGKSEGHDEDANPFANLQKSNVLQESKVFNAATIEVRLCSDVLTQMLYLLDQGETLAEEEATNLYFGVTKLFQSKDPALRRLLYLAIQELAKIESENAWIVISSLEKDVNSNNELFHANAIRVLSKILDASQVQQRERYLSQATVSGDPFVQSAALMSGIRLIPKAKDVISRWVNKVQEAVKCKEDNMVSYHALQLLHMIKTHDRRAIAKQIFSLTKRPPTSPFAMTLLVRYIYQFLSRLSNETTLNEDMMKFLTRALNHKSNIVVLESAKSICALKNASEAQVTPAVEALTDMLNSHIAVERFAAIQVLDQVVDRFPLLVGNRADVELESLISDAQRNIAVLAITTMMKTGREATVDTLCNQIESFMVHLSDDLKVVLVEAIKSLCLKFPKKYQSLMAFLSKALREEGNFMYKKNIVDSILILMDKIPVARSVGLEHLCEFIEDCEFPKLVIRILHELGEVGPTIPNPARYIRFIFNRVLLELPEVRAVAVNALSKFGAGVPELRDDIIALLNRCLVDDDDIVRDRAIAAISFLQSGQEVEKVSFTTIDLEYSLNKYLAGGHFGNNVVIEPAPEETKKVFSATQSDGEEEEEELAPAPINVMNFTEILTSCEDFADYGEIWKSSKAVSLTEEEGEYQVSVIKHIYQSHIVFHFICANTIEDQALCDVSVELECEDFEFEKGVTIPCEVLRKDDHEQHIFVSMGFEFDELQQILSEESLEFSAILKFLVKETPEEDDLEFLEDIEGYDDEYELNAVEMDAKDFVKGVLNMSIGQFKKEFQAIPKENQAKHKFALPLATIQPAVNFVVDKLGLAGVEFSTNVPEGQSQAMVNLSGSHISGASILARALFKQSTDKQNRERIIIQIGIVSEDPEIPPSLLMPFHVRNHM